MKKIICLLLFSNIIIAQTACYTSSNVISFNYSGHSYKIVKELKNWSNAAACAVSDGGYLVEIADASEQNAISATLSTSGISTSYHAVADAGGTSYVWIGASDLTTEGHWIWDGDNNGNGTNFWNGEGQAGAGTGSVIASAYNNWGQTNGTGLNNEPDNYNNIQNAGAIAMTGWPSGGSSYGTTWQWNDIDASNTLYYIIEYNTLLMGVNNLQSDNNNLNIYPNPISNQFVVEGDFVSISVKNIEGETIPITTHKSNTNTTIDISSLANGIYFLVCTDKLNNQSTKKVYKLY